MISSISIFRYHDHIYQMLIGTFFLALITAFAIQSTCFSLANLEAVSIEYRFLSPIG